MPAFVMPGPRVMSGNRDRDGYRTYQVSHLVRVDSGDGPYVALHAPGLPAIGSAWQFESAEDAWAYCTPEATVTEHQEHEGAEDGWWIVTQTFTNKPAKRCQDTQPENPLSEPDRISGGFRSFTEADPYDKDGNPKVNSAWELLTGPAAEEDKNRPTVTIEKNLGTLPLSTFSQMINTLNDAPLWGVGARCVKLANATWSRKVYGTCSYYYTVSYEFEISYTSYDITVLDEGTKVLAFGGNPNNPRHFETYKDPTTQENSHVILKNGLAWRGPDIDGPPGQIFVQKYTESNFLLLGIPTSL